MQIMNSSSSLPNQSSQRYSPFQPKQIDIKNKSSQKSKAKNTKKVDGFSKEQSFNENGPSNDYNFAAHIQQYNFEKMGLPPKLMEDALRSAVKQAKQISSSRRIESGNSSFSNRDSEIMENMKKRINSLIEENAKLRYDNQQLKKQVTVLQKKMTEISKKKKAEFKATSSSDYQMKHTLSPRSSKENQFNMPDALYPKSSTATISSPLLKQLLLDCNQSNQFEQQYATKATAKTKGSLSDGKDEFYEYKDTRDCCEPFYSHLNRDNQLRMKKSMIREKQLLFKDDFIEIGCLNAKKSDYEFTMNVVLTNIMSQSIRQVNIAYLCKQDIKLVKQLKSTNLDVQKSTKYHTIYRKLGSAQQLRQKLTIQTHTVDFRCILIHAQFVDHKGLKRQVSQILPGCKHRLFTNLVNTPIPQKYIVAEKVVVADRKILPDLQKLKTYYKHIIFTSDRNHNKEAILKIQFLGKIFFVSMRNVGDQNKVSIAVYHNGKQDSMIADKILSEFTFLYGK